MLHLSARDSQLYQRSIFPILLLDLYTRDAILTVMAYSTSRPSQRLVVFDTALYPVAKRRGNHRDPIGYAAYRISGNHQQDST